MSIQGILPGLLVAVAGVACGGGSADIPPGEQDLAVGDSRTWRTFTAELGTAGTTRAQSVTWKFAMEVQLSRVSGPDAGVAGPAQVRAALYESGSSIPHPVDISLGGNDANGRVELTATTQCGGSTECRYAFRWSLDRLDHEPATVHASWTGKVEATPQASADSPPPSGLTVREGE